MVDHALPVHRRLLGAGRVDADAHARPRGRCRARAIGFATCFTLFRTWFVFGFPAFGAGVAIFWLMIADPSSSC
jgi:uncharacterized membrane protein